MHAYTPTLEEFRCKAREGNLVPVYREILGDLETPVSAFKKLDDGRYAFLLESVEGGEKWGRYSFIGVAPSAVLSCQGTRMVIESGGTRQTRNVRDPITGLEAYLRRYRPVPVPGLPRFVGGAVGYLGYECARFLEDSIGLPEGKRGDLPDAQFFITGPLLVFDNLAHTIKVVVNAAVTDDADKSYKQATRQIDQIVDRLRSFTPTHYTSRKSAHRPVWSSTASAADFERIVRRAQEHILAGDVFQIVLSHQLSTRIASDPFDVYRALRQMNPSPYMYFLRFGNDVVLGASPEALVRKEDDVLELRPIAGTRPRGATRVDDLRLEEELRQSDKERAEHIMLVDLGRNDLGRVAQYGSVVAEELMIVERYSHVMHLVSGVRGLARDGINCFDVLRACFPAGTVSGAPKVRAMQLIHAMEKRRRGVYAGGVGYFGFDGNMDICIAIRTVLCRDGQASIGAGAGIVANSNPRLEYDETRSKAQALVAAIEMAELGLE
ncbi:MAG TPA: anthranilate synthase component I [Candidatus Krumholzibacteria bacterium]|nr:anthranilate synthase component I [Candidatus Krumholzibacteria bacterium]